MESGRLVLNGWLSSDDEQFIKGLLKYIDEVYDEFTRIYDTPEFEEVKKELEKDEGYRLVPSRSVSLSKLGRCEFLAFMKRRQHLMSNSDFYVVSDTMFLRSGRSQSVYQDRGVWFDRFLKWKLGQSEFASSLSFDVELSKEVRGVLFYTRIDVAVDLPSGKRLGLEIKSGNIWDYDVLVKEYDLLFFDYVIVYSPFLMRKVRMGKRVRRGRFDLMFDDGGIVVHSGGDSMIEEFLVDYAERISNWESSVFKAKLEFCAHCPLRNKCKVRAFFDSLPDEDKSVFIRLNDLNKLKFVFFVRSEGRDELNDLIRRYRGSL